MDFFKYFIYIFINDELSQNLTLQLGIASGLVTLSALVTIFISINKQHTIQKCKELIWEIELIITGDSKEYNKEKIRSKFILYQNIMNEPLLLKFNPIFLNFNNLALLITAVFLFFTIRIWVSIGISLDSNSKEVAIISALLVLIFSLLLLTLLSVGVTGNLNKPKNILNGNKKTKLKTKDIASTVSSIILRTETYTVFGKNVAFLRGNINISLPVTNIEISPLIYGITYNRKKDSTGKISKTNSIKNMDMLCTPYFSEESVEVKIQYLKNFQKKVILRHVDNNEVEKFRTGSIRIGNNPISSMRNSIGMMYNREYPVGYNYGINFIKYKYDSNNKSINFERDHGEYDIDISMYDKLEICCYFRSKEGTTYVEYGNIDCNTFESNEDNIINLNPISMSTTNKDFNKFIWKEQVHYQDD